MASCMGSLVCNRVFLIEGEVGPQVGLIDTQTVHKVLDPVTGGEYYTAKLLFGQEILWENSIT
jgi:hypothetical protein